MSRPKAKRGRAANYEGSIRQVFYVYAKTDERRWQIRRHSRQALAEEMERLRQEFGKSIEFSPVYTRWQVRVTLGYDHKGAPVRKSAYCDTQAEARLKRDEIIREHEEGVPECDPSNMTLGQWIDQWLELFVVMNVQENTADMYRRVVRKHIKPTLGNIPLLEVSTFQLQSLVSEKLKTVPRQTANIYSLLGRALKKAHQMKMIRKNPMEEVEYKPKREKRKNRAVPLEWVRKFLASAKDDRLFAGYVLALGGGLRRGEILGLKWSDIDWKQGEVEIRRSVVMCKGGHTVKSTKTENSDRIVPLPPFVLEALRQWKAEQDREKELAEEAYKDEGWIFAWEDGRVVSPRGFHHRFVQAIEKAGLPRARIHDCRHTYATYLMQQGVSPNVVAALLGHARSAFTVERYGGSDRFAEREAVKRLAPLFFSSEESVS